MLTEEGKGIYRALKTALAARGGVPEDTLFTLIETLPSTNTDRVLLAQALGRALSVFNEAHRVPALSSGDPQGPSNPANVGDLAPNGSLAIAAESLDYQIAVLKTASQYSTSSLSLLGGLNGALGGRTVAQGAPLSNQWDIAGAEATDNPYFMVSRSQYRYGQEVPIFIEDQPLTRGNAGWEAVKAFFSNFAIKLLVPDYSRNDFGDTHSLVLLVDTLSLMSSMQAIDQNISPNTINQILAAASNLKGEGQGSTDQGGAEGNTIETVLDALRRVIVSPGASNTLTPEQMEDALDGNTWAQPSLREPVHVQLRSLDEAIAALKASSGPSFTVQSLQ